MLCREGGTAIAEGCLLIWENLKCFALTYKNGWNPKTIPLIFNEKHDCPSWVSQANTRQLLLSDLIPTTHFPAFQKALEKGPTSTSNDCKHTTDSLDTLFLNAAGLFPLALAEEPTPLFCLGRSRWEGSRENYKWGVRGPNWLECDWEHHQRQSIHLWHIKKFSCGP